MLLQLVRSHRVQAIATMASAKHLATIQNVHLIVAFPTLPEESEGVNDDGIQRCAVFAPGTV